MSAALPRPARFVLVLVALAGLLLGLLGLVADPAAAAAESRTTTSRPVVVLRYDGLGFRTGTTTIHFRFGADARPVLAQLKRAFGGSFSSTLNSECGQGPRVIAGRAHFSILIKNNRFAGWFDGGAAGRRLRSAHGLGVGVTLARFRQVLRGVTTANDTLGPEFFSRSGFGGTLTGLRPTSRATAVYAGETCFFR